MSQTTKNIGDQGEDMAVSYLEKRGFKIVARNWRTRYCEIDIVVKNQQCLYFVEVKTRKSNRFGDGIDYVTPKKLRQMSFAAELWVAEHEWGGDFRLSVVGITAGKITFLDEL